MNRIGKDYSRFDTRRPSLLRLRWVALACVLPLMVAAFAMTIRQASAPRPAGVALTPSPVGDAVGTAESTTDASASRAAAKPSDMGGYPQAAANTGNGSATAEYAKNDTGDHTWIHIKIHPGDTLSLAFERHGLSYSDSLAIAHLDEYGQQFTLGLRPGDTLKVRATGSGHVLAVKYPLGAVRTLTVHAAANGYTARVVRAATSHRKAYAVVTINQSFYVDALEAGLSDGVIMDLAYIFGWQIDFVHDINKGDQFIVVYQQLYADGRKVRDGHILAAEFIGNERTLRALRYTGEGGKGHYYTPDGEAVRRAFRRVPLDNNYYISSSFSYAREHPILNTVRAHEGTDFAAPMGTPIHATGAGEITFRGVMSGYGNMVIIDHGNGYTTRYGHMSHFASGQHLGSHVDQGEVIGYVGMTGLATGPHVHYEFRVNGVPKNPETVDLPGAPPVPEGQMADFKAHIKPLLAQINSLEHVKLASTQTGE